MKSRVLGFDLRIGEGEKARRELWPEQRRNQFLLRSGVSAPFSIDTNVWPSLFYVENSPLNAIAFPTPATESSFHQQGLRLWSNLPEMKAAISDAAHTPIIGSVACFTLEGEESSISEERWRMAFQEPTVPTELGAEWKLRVYDVADVFFTSSLSNCGYNAEDLDRARPVWRDFLNTDGLFTSAAEARRFKEFSDKRIYSHAPFYVFGIYTAVN
jgi:hypothetical protein